MKVLMTAVAALMVVPAMAAAPSDNPLARDKVVMSLRKLDLATVEGQRGLAVRMDQAARAVCGDQVATIHIALGEQSRACQAEVKADIRARIEARTAAADAGTARSTLLALR